MDVTLLGPASRFAMREYGGIFNAEEVAVPVGVAPVVVVPNDPRCIGVIIINTGTTNITLARGSPVVSGVGVLLLGNGASLSLTARDDGDVTAQAWNAVSDLAGGSVYVQRTIQAFGADQQPE